MFESLTNKTLHGLKWSYAFTGLNFFSQLLFTYFLARLLSPKDFGLMAMANVILRFGSYFSQMGIGTAIIQKKKLDDEDIITAYLTTFVISTLFCILIIIMAPLAEILFHNSEIVNIVRIMSLSFIFSSVSTISISILRKTFQFKLLGTLDFVSFLFGNTLLAILLASLGFGVWSLVIASIAHSLLLLVLTTYYIKKNITFAKFSLNSAKLLLNYGGKYSFSSFLEFLTYSSDTMIIGYYFTPTLLGIYNRATLLVQLPSQLISANLIKVLFPSLNELRLEKERFIKYHQTITLILGSILFGMCLFISINAREIVLIVLGDRWLGCIDILKVFALSIPFHLLINYYGLVYDVYGLMNYKILIKSVHFFVMVIVFLFLKTFGLIGIALGFVITELAFYFFYIQSTSKVLKIKTVIMIHLHRPLILIIASVAVPSIILKYITGTMNFNLILSMTFQTVLIPLIAIIIIARYTPKEFKKSAAELVRSGNGGLKNGNWISFQFNKYINKLAG